MTTLKVPKVGIQVLGGEKQGILLFRREAMRQRPSRETLERKSSTASTDSEDALDVIDFGVRPTYQSSQTSGIQAIFCGEFKITRSWEGILSKETTSKVRQTKRVNEQETSKMGNPATIYPHHTNKWPV